MDARERWQDDCWKSKWWDSSDWSVYLTRYYTASDRVTVLLQRDDDSYIAWVRVNDAGGDCSIPWPWPWNLTPTTPAEVCAMCERLADQYTTPFSG